MSELTGMYHDAMTYAQASSWLGPRPILGGALVEQAMVRDPYADGPHRDADPYTRRVVGEYGFVGRWRERRGGGPRSRWRYVTVHVEGGMCRAWIDDKRRTAAIRYATLSAPVTPHLVAVDTAGIRKGQ